MFAYGKPRVNFDEDFKNHSFIFPKEKLQCAQYFLEFWFPYRETVSKSSNRIVSPSGNTSKSSNCFHIGKLAWTVIHETYVIDFKPSLSFE